MRFSLRSTSTRTFVALPLALAAEQAVRRSPLHLGALPLLASGYAAYKLAGGFRIGRAGGPPGMSQGMPERLVTGGVYAWTRNPMYLGHLTFMTGAALVTRSPLAIGALALAGPWFGRRVAADEARLRTVFGEAYDDYLARVPRWLPRPPGI